MRLLFLAVVCAGCAGSSSRASAPDLSTPAGLLEAVQAAAAAGDTAGLVALGMEPPSEYQSYPDSVVAGGPWHDRVMATTPADLEGGYGNYSLTLWEDIAVDEAGDEVGSNVVCVIERVEDDYRIAGCIAAG